MSATNSPRPRKCRSSSLRNSEAPTPLFVFPVCMAAPSNCHHEDTKGTKYRPSPPRKRGSRASGMTVALDSRFRGNDEYQRGLSSCLRGEPLIEQREIDHVDHMAIAGVALMQPVAAIPFRRHLGRYFRVAHSGIEISDTVEGATLADPGVERDPVLLARRVPRIGHERL